MIKGNVIYSEQRAQDQGEAGQTIETIAWERAWIAIVAGNWENRKWKNQEKRLVFTDITIDSLIRQ